MSRTPMQKCVPNNYLYLQLHIFYVVALHVFVLYIRWDCEREAVL